MATKTVHTLAYRIMADTKDLQQGLTLSRREVSAARRELAKIETPLDKYNRKQEQLGRLAAGGAMSQKQMNAALDKYRLELGLANTRQEKFKRGLDKIKTGLSGARLAAAGAAVALGSMYAIGRNMTGQMTETDELIKFSRQVGIATNDLIRFQLVAAKASGVAGPEFNNAFQTMTRRVAEAGAGTGEAVGALKELNLTASAMNRMQPDKQFLAIAEALSQVGDQAKKNELAYDLFGRQGQKLVNMLSLGSAGIRSQGKEADSLGATLRGTGAEIEAANDAMTDLSTAWKGLGRAMNDTFLPALTSLVQQVTKLIAGPNIQASENPYQEMGWAQTFMGALTLSPRDQQNLINNTGYGGGDAGMSQTAAARAARLRQQEAERKANGTGNQGGGALTTSRNRKSLIAGFNSLVSGARGAGAGFMGEAQGNAQQAVGKIGELFSNAFTNIARGQYQAAVTRSEMSAGRGDPRQAGRFGPGQSLAAGGADAFRFLNQQGRDIPKQQLDQAKATADNTGTLVGLFQEWLAKSPQAESETAGKLFGSPGG